MADPAYISVASLKAWMRITDTVDDTLLGEAINASARAIDKHCGRRFWLDAAPSARIFTPAGRIVRGDPARFQESFLVDDIGDPTGLVAEIGYGSTWSPVSGVEYLPDNAIARGRPVTSLLRVDGWPISGTQRLRVSAVKWGWPVAAPDEVVQSNRILAARVFRRKNSPEGVAASAEWGPVRVTRVDPDVESLLRPFVIHALA